MKMKIVLFFLAVVLIPTTGALATSDPNFYIYLCFGQSNVEGGGNLSPQGESNSEDKDWPRKVKIVYDNLMKDLNLKPESAPLLAGEKAGANKIIKRLPERLSTPPRPQGPCDIYAAAGAPCVAAHSTTRALYASYNGPLYQVLRQSDGKTLDIGVIQPVASPMPDAGGYANAAAQDAFCSNTFCWIT